jgi:hypothetical protein
MLEVLPVRNLGVSKMKYARSRYYVLLKIPPSNGPAIADEAQVTCYIRNSEIEPKKTLPMNSTLRA